MAVVAVDPFPGAMYGVGDSYPHAFAITPSDSDELVAVVRAINVTVAGNIAVVTLGGESVTLAVPVGLFRCRIRQVKATLTTATGLVGLY